MVRFILHATNGALILGMIGCMAGALAGLIVLLPFVAGAWGLNLMALVAYENNREPVATPGPAEAVRAEPDPQVSRPELRGEAVRA